MKRERNKKKNVKNKTSIASESFCGQFVQFTCNCQKVFFNHCLHKERKKIHIDVCTKVAVLTSKLGDRFLHSVVFLHCYFSSWIKLDRLVIDLLAAHSFLATRFLSNLFIPTHTYTPCLVHLGCGRPSRVEHLLDIFFLFWSHIFFTRFIRFFSFFGILFSLLLFDWLLCLVKTFISIYFLLFSLLLLNSKKNSLWPITTNDSKEHTRVKKNKTHGIKKRKEKKSNIHFESTHRTHKYTFNLIKHAHFPPRQFNKRREPDMTDSLVNLINNYANMGRKSWNIVLDFRKKILFIPSLTFKSLTHHMFASSWLLRKPNQKHQKRKKILKNSSKHI